MLGYLLLNVGATVFLFILTLYLTLLRHDSRYSYLALAFLFELFVPFLDPPYFQLVILPYVSLPSQYVIVYLNILFLFAALLVSVQSVFIYRTAFELKYPDAVFLGLSSVVLFYLCEMLLIALGVVLSIPVKYPYILALIAKSIGLLFFGFAMLSGRAYRKFYPLSTSFGIGFFVLSLILKTTYSNNLSVMGNLYLLETVGKILLAIGLFGVQFLSVKRTTTSLSISGAFLTKNKRTFEDLLKGSEGIVLITRNPTTIKNGKVFWLTESREGEREGIFAVAPTNLGILLDILTNDLKSGYGGIFMDAVEYAIVENGPTTVLKFLIDLKDRVIQQGRLMVIYVNPKAVDERSMRILEREFSPLG